MRVTLALLPGLDLPSLERHDWPRVARQLDSSRVARLATVRFPARPADLDAALTAELAASGPLLEQGEAWVHPAGELPVPELEADLERLRAVGPAGGELQLLRLPALAAAMARAGGHGAEAAVTRAALDEGLAARLATADPGHMVWVAGVAPFAPRRQHFVAEGPGLRSAEGCALELDAAAGDAHGQWLGRPGAERVLEGEGLERFGGSGGRWLLLEPGWSASAGEVVAGHPADPMGAAPALLAVGGVAGRPWPATVHLSRLAPTLVRAMGWPAREGTDRPLAGGTGQT